MTCLACRRGSHRICWGCDCDHRADPAARASTALTELAAAMRDLLTPDTYLAVALPPLTVLARAVPGADIPVPAPRPSTDDWPPELETS